MSKHVCCLPGCEIESNNQCSRCKKVYYCSVAHQSKHWKEHKIQCKERQPETIQDTKPAHTETLSKSPGDESSSEVKSCRCMFCGELLECKSESEAVEHMAVCPSLQEQLNDDRQFTLPNSMK